MKFTTPYNYIQPPGETNTLPSMTIPGQTLSIAQMLKRAQNGIPLEVSNLPYLEDEFTPKDLTDLETEVIRFNQSRTLFDEVGEKKKEVESEPGKNDD